jgi:hypothetical protein
MLALSSIGETAIGELPPLPVEKDLGISAFSSVSFKAVIPETVAELVADIISTQRSIYYGGNRNSWLAVTDIGVEFTTSQAINYPIDIIDLVNTIDQTTTIRYEIPQDIIETTLLGIDSLQVRYNYPEFDTPLTTTVESRERPSWLISDPTPLTIQGEMFHTFKKNFFDDATLDINVIEKLRVDDTPSEAWRPRPGLPIGPIGFNPIGIEQWDGGQTTFGDVSAAELIISGDIILNKTFNYSIGPELKIGESPAISVRYNSIDSTVDTVLFLETKTYTKEYTFLIQEFLKDQIDLTIAIQSAEVYVESPGISVQTRGSQIWIGA